MINILEIYNFFNTVYSWYMWIGIIVVILIVTAVISKITKRWGIFGIPAGVLIPLLIICIIGSFNPKGSGSFDYYKRQEIEKLGLTYNKYNGSYEDETIHLFVSYDLKIGSTYKLIEECTEFYCIDRNIDILKIFIKDRLDLHLIDGYLLDYSEVTNKDAHIEFNYNDKGIYITYYKDTRKIEYTIDYRERFYDKEGKEVVNKEDEITIEHYPNCSDYLDSSLILSIYGDSLDKFDLYESGSTHIYRRKEKRA